MLQGGHIVIGVFVGLLSTGIQSLGLTLQRKSHILEDEKEVQDTKRPPYRRRRWQLGMFMFIVSNIVGSTIQITTLPLPVLSTLQASGLVFNSICATLILGETFTRWSFVGTVLVSIGALLIALFGAISEPAHNLDQLIALLGHRQFIIWIASTMIIVMGILATAKFTKTVGAQQGYSPRARLLRGMAYGGVSGILSAHSLLVAKSAVELIVRSVVDHNNQFNRFPSWAILIGLLFLALSQLYFLHRGLKLCSTSILYPFVFCVYNIIAILDGLIYFRQTSRLSILSILMVTLGTVILLLGVVSLSWRLNQDQTNQPIMNQGTLTPGLGFAPSDTDSEETDSLLGPTYEDEEAAPKLKQASTFPIQSSAPMSETVYGTMKAKRRMRLAPPGSLRISKIRRAKTAIYDADEIWDELEEGSHSNVGSPISTRRISFQARAGTPFMNTSRGNISPTMDSSTELPPLTPNEQTTLLRSSTGRSYRGLKSRQTSTSSAGHARKKSQDAVGGWWKMQRWWNGSRSNKDQHDPSGRTDSGTAV